MGAVRRFCHFPPPQNFTSRAVMECLGSVLTNKYAEGLPHARYYGGNEFIDMVRPPGVEGQVGRVGGAWAHRTPWVRQRRRRLWVHGMCAR
jgi:hypothetical protein